MASVTESKTPTNRQKTKKQPNAISELTNSFLLSAIDHACNNAKISIEIFRSRFEEWKQTKMDEMSEDQKLDEEYIINYLNKRNEYDEAYTKWITQRKEKIQNMKNTDIHGEQTILMKELHEIEFPEVLSTPAPDIYTKYKANQ